MSLKKIPWQKLSFIMGGLSVVFALVLGALSEHLHVFYTPTELQKKIEEGVLKPPFAMRLGGLVQPQSVRHNPERDLAVTFIVTDFQAQYTVHYTGVLPDLFKEGTGVIVDGRLEEDGGFSATNVLAKHDENYKPPALKHL
jgi:cytochrome c-type biogenesis protein CcmE